MRKTILFSVIAVFIFSIFACSKNSNDSSDADSVQVALSTSPETALRQYIKFIQEGNYKALVDGINPKNAHWETELAKDSSFLQKVVDFNKQQFERMGGIKDFKIQGSTLSQHGDSAVVQNSLTYGNDSVDTQPMYMVKLDGIWYMDPHQY